MMWVSGIFYGLVTALCYFPGFMLFAWYEIVGCNPLMSGEIKNPNQASDYMQNQFRHHLEYGTESPDLLLVEKFRL
jgi:hypothetical protein